ncbi:MAG: ABC transporter permease subunit [Planctomycetota bacterium]|jgi:ABC-2 type transport system permease protein
MRGLLAKSWRDVRVATILFGVGLLLVEMFLTLVLPQIYEEISQIWLEIPFVRTIVQSLMGIDVDEGLTAQMLQAIVWVHPVVLSLIWAHEIILCTRMPAGEIDRGTIDVLLGLPVSRRALYLSETTAWLVSGLAVIALGFVGYWIGSQSLAPINRPGIGRVALVMVNLALLYVAVGGVAFLVSALSDRRGRAIAVVFGLLLASFLLNFLAGFWPPAERFAFLSVLTYYQPAFIIQDARVPAGDAAVLLGTGVTAWVAGGEVLARRSICTV